MLGGCKLFVWQWLIRAIAIVSLIILTVAVGTLHGFAQGAVETGDASRGKELFGKLPCASCHDVTRPWPGGDVCPNLGNIATEAARIVRLPQYRGKAKDAAGYIRESIIDPNAYIVPGPNYRTPDGQSVMPKDFAQTLNAKDLNDVVAFLLTRK
jgi:nitric oxide reductase subunit C